MTIQDHLLALEARTARVNVQYGGESRTISFVASVDPWARLEEQRALASQVQNTLFDLMTEKTSTNSITKVVSDGMMP